MFLFYFHNTQYGKRAYSISCTLISHGWLIWPPYMSADASAESMGSPLVCPHPQPSPHFPPPNPQNSMQRRSHSIT